MGHSNLITSKEKGVELPSQAKQYLAWRSYICTVSY